MADDFEARQYSVVRYSLDPQYIDNKQEIQECDIVFVAVPTPTTPDGFSFELVKEVLPLVRNGATVAIKSTLLPGTTNELQQEFPDIYVMHAPEFLREKNAAEDSSNPERNIIGIPVENKEYRGRAERILSVLPRAKYNLITSSYNAESIKHIGNAFLYTKVVFMNIMHDLVVGEGGDWSIVGEAVGNDSRIGHSHMKPVHESGRGAGGHCFIKDFEALIRYSSDHPDQKSVEVLKALRAKNNELLVSSGKDMDLYEGVYGLDDKPL